MKVDLNNEENIDFLPNFLLTFQHTYFIEAAVKLFFSSVVKLAIVFLLISSMFPDLIIKMNFQLMNPENLCLLSIEDFSFSYNINIFIIFTFR